MKKNNVLTVMNKELARFFGDKRMILMILLPAILIYAVYSFMGTAMLDVFTPDDDYTPKVYTVNIPKTIEDIFEQSGITVEKIDIDQEALMKESIKDKDSELLAVFPLGFMELISEYNPVSSEMPAPNIELYYNSTLPNSTNSYYLITAILNDYESSLANIFDINKNIPNADLATAEDMSASMISMMMPMMLMLFLYQGCAAFAPESISGEKERGTLATLLATPMKRSELAAGKILSLCVLSFLSGLITAGATILSLPNLMNADETHINAGIYSTYDYTCLLAVILSTILLLVALISIISAFSKTVKEANTAVMPLMVIVMLIGVTGMFSNTQANTYLYAIPLYGSVQSMSGIFSMAYSTGQIAISCLSNIILACVGGFILTKMFNSEKVMFS